jgi:ABC-type multidrug transport system ATPase subunit
VNSDEALSFARLEKHYGQRHVLSISSLAMVPGRIVHLSGRNGAGKTTLLKILAGLEPPDCCAVTLDSRTLPWRAVRRRLRRDVVYLHQQPYMFDDTVAGNLSYGLRVTGVPRARRHRALSAMLERMDLAHAAQRNARTLSGGEQQRLALARAWLLQPRVLLLDEPTANMDSDFRRQTWLLLQDMLRDDLSIMVSSHELSQADCPDCLNLQLRDGRLNAGHPSLHLVGQGWSRAPDCAGVVP